MWQQFPGMVPGENMKVIEDAPAPGPGRSCLSWRRSVGGKTLLTLLLEDSPRAHYQQSGADGVLALSNDWKRRVQ